jgi:hypothetical protein
MSEPGTAFRKSAKTHDVEDFLADFDANRGQG